MFKRLKTKELFAFLVDRRGAGMTAKQICAVLFPDDTDDTQNAAYLRQPVRGHLRYAAVQKINYRDGLDFECPMGKFHMF